MLDLILFRSTGRSRRRAADKGSQPDRRSCPNADHDLIDTGPTTAREASVAAHKSNEWDLVFGQVVEPRRGAGSA